MITETLSRSIVLLAAFALVAPARAPTRIGEDVFVDHAAAAGLDFVHFNGMTGDLHMVEVMGSGAALLDYDNDGDLDVYLVQGQLLGEDKSAADAVYTPSRPLPATDSLYRNDSRQGGTLKFTDVSVAAGIHVTSYGMGVVSGDIDNDGWIDLYITAFGANSLLKNNGDGTFTDITESAGVNESRWSVSASFFDYDRDGLLDLYVVNYVDFSLDNVKPCFTDAATPEYCGPLTHNGVPDRLFHNLGDGRFEDVSKAAGIDKMRSNGLGVVTADFDANGWLDVYVANDGVANQLWLNQGDSSFIDDALLAGAALNSHGAPEASMGVDAADYDRDGDEDIFITHLAQESNTLYNNDGTGWFEDITASTGLGPPSFPLTGFGTGWFDYDNDGWLDVIAANGAVHIKGEITSANPYPVDQTNQLFHNTGQGRYEDVTERSGAIFKLSEVSRGVAFGDVDNDGDTDVLMLNNSGRVRLLINQTGQDQSWIGLRMLDENGRFDVLGALVTLERNGGPAQLRRVRTDGSYASARDPRLLFGLAGNRSKQSVLVTWPAGKQERWAGLAVGKYHALKRGSGEPATPSEE